MTVSREVIDLYHLVLQKVTGLVPHGTGSFAFLGERHAGAGAIGARNVSSWPSDVARRLGGCDNINEWNALTSGQSRL
jgi:hypothetical protein